MNVLCVGAGAVGGCVAAHLQEAGVDVHVCDANEAHVHLLRDRGLVAGGLDGGRTTRMCASTSVDIVPDVVLLAVRSHATAAALESVVPHMTAQTDVVSLQNGLNEDRIAAVVGAERTVGCVVGFGATWIEPGHIELNASGGLIVGRLDGSTDGRLDAIRGLLDLAFPTRVTTNISGALWGKMLVNSMTVLGALGGMLTGELLSTPERRRVVGEIIAEGVRVARAEGVRLPKVLGVVDASLVDAADWAAAVDAALLKTADAFGAIKSVTWRDFEIGRPTEVDAVTGEIVARGVARGVPTPRSAAALRMLREIEAQDRHPSAENLELLDA